MFSKRFIRRTGTAVVAGTALLSGTVAMASGASAAPTLRVALIPKVAPRVDVALGAFFPSVSAGQQRHQPGRDVGDHRSQR